MRIVKYLPKEELLCFFFFSSRRRHTRLQGDWSSDVCSSDLAPELEGGAAPGVGEAVEAFLKERERREDAAALQALDDLLVEQRIDLAQGLAGTLAVVGADEGEAGGGQGPEALAAGRLPGSGNGAPHERRR